MPDLDAYAAERRLRDATVVRLRGLGADGCAAVLEVAAPLGMNDNHLRDMLDLVEDIAARRCTDVSAVLRDAAIAAALRGDGGRSDRIRALKACLRRLRYPQLSAALDRIAARRQEMGLPGGVSLDLPENLEGDEVTITVRAASPAQLRSRVASLARALEGDGIDAIFAIWQEAEG